MVLTLQIVLSSLEVITEFNLGMLNFEIYVGWDMASIKYEAYVNLCA